VKFVLGLIVIAGLTVGAWTLLTGGESSSGAVSLTESVEPDPSDVGPNNIEDSKTGIADTPTKTVLEIESETGQRKPNSDNPEAEAQAELNIEILDGNGDALAGGGSNKVQKALENILGGSTVLGGPATGELSNEEMTANLEHDAIKTETWVHLEEALTVEGFDSLAISQALLGPQVDDVTKEAIKSLVTVGEENPEQIQRVVSEIRKLLGLVALNE